MNTSCVCEPLFGSLLCRSHLRRPSRRRASKGASKSGRRAKAREKATGCSTRTGKRTICDTPEDRQEFKVDRPDGEHVRTRRPDPPFGPGAVSPKLLLVDVGRLRFKPVHQIDDKIFEGRHIQSREGTNRFFVNFNAQSLTQNLNFRDTRMAGANGILSA